MTTPTHRPCASVVIKRILDDGTQEVLLVHKDREKDDWQIPQGGLEEGETAEEAAKREMMEETNIDLNGIELTQSEHTYQYDYPKSFIDAEKPRYAGQHLTFFTALVPADTKVQVDNKELDEYKWVKPEEIKEYLDRENYRKVVEEVIAKSSGNG